MKTVRAIGRVGANPSAIVRSCAGAVDASESKSVLLLAGNAPCVPTIVPMMPRRFEMDAAASCEKQAMMAVMEKKCAMRLTGAAWTVRR